MRPRRLSVNDQAAPGDQVKASSQGREPSIRLMGLVEGMMLQGERSWTQETGGRGQDLFSLA
jgi:hypothetical protein